MESTSTRCSSAFFNAGKERIVRLGVEIDRSTAIHKFLVSTASSNTDYDHDGSKEPGLHELLEDL